uniref:Uncharacterized protein n=1 Tax=Anguilla anguilla TaxID=7936 RepID=A0A0E9XC71_ANGAN
MNKFKIVLRLKSNFSLMTLARSATTRHLFRSTSTQHMRQSDTAGGG